MSISMLACRQPYNTSRLDGTDGALALAGDEHVGTFGHALQQTTIWTSAVVAAKSGHTGSSLRQATLAHNNDRSGLAWPLTSLPYVTRSFAQTGSSVSGVSSQSHAAHKSTHIVPRKLVPHARTSRQTT